MKFGNIGNCGQRPIGMIKGFWLFWAGNGGSRTVVSIRGGAKNAPSATRLTEPWSRYIRCTDYSTDGAVVSIHFATRPTVTSGVAPRVWAVHRYRARAAQLAEAKSHLGWRRALPQSQYQSERRAGVSGPRLAS